MAKAKAPTPARMHCKICRTWLRVEYLDDRGRGESCAEQIPLFKEAL